MGRHAAAPNNVIHSLASRNALHLGAAISTATQVLQQKAR